MPVGQVKRLFRGLCPPVLWETARLCFRRAPSSEAPSPPPEPALPYRLVFTLEELETEFDRVRAAAVVSHDAFVQAQDAFRYRTPADLPADPSSPEYREAQLAFYRLVSGRGAYSAQECEQYEFTDHTRKRPYPYYTRSCTTVGEQLMAVGFMMRAMALESYRSVLEFGFGYGLLTLQLARADFAVTGVDINPLYLDLVSEYCRKNDLQVELVCSGMLDYRPQKRFDRVVFYESFHHCDDHEALVARLDELVAEGGAVVFGGEPISDDFPMPWGVRTDGRSLWAIRMHGWLELGFRTEYFVALLARYGWTTQMHTSADVPWQRVFVARRTSES